MVTEEELRRKARKKARAKLGFFIHLGAFIFINPLLVLIWYFTTGVGSFPWFIFPLFGWGMGLFVHYIVTFFSLSGFMTDMVEREYEKLKENDK